MRCGEGALRGQKVQAGQRAFVGLVCIDRNSKDFYTKSLQQNVEDTQAFIAHVRCMWRRAALFLHARRPRTPTMAAVCCWVGRCGLWVLHYSS